MVCFGFTVNTIWCVSDSKGCVYQYHRHRFPILTHFQMCLLPSVCMRSLIGFQLVDKSSLGNHWKAATGSSSDQYLETGRVTQVIQALRWGLLWFQQPSIHCGLSLCLLLLSHDCTNPPSIVHEVVSNVNIDIEYQSRDFLRVYFFFHPPKFSSQFLKRSKISRIRQIFKIFRGDLISRMATIRIFQGIKFRGFSRIRPKSAKSAKFNPHEI